MTDTACTKRELLKKGFKAGLAGAITLGLGNTFINSIDALVNTADSGTDGSASSYAESAVHLPSMDEIDSLMARGSVDKILKDDYDLGTIEQIKRKAYSKETNFRDLVYQEDKQPLDKRPSLVMFYVNSDKGQNSDAQTREAIIFKSLAKSFSKDLDFLAYDVSISHDYFKSKSNKSYFGKESQDKEGITAVPSIGMYSVFDLTEYEEPKINDGKIKQIDILRGGPTKTSSILQWFKTDASMNNWIKYNVTEPNGSYVYRVNTNSVKQIFY